MFRRPFGNRYGFASPWQEMERMRREMNRLLSSTGTRRVAPGYPAMNVWTNQDGAVVTAELPGLSPEDIDISVVGDTLTVRGSRQAEELDNVQYHRRERNYGKFSRTFQLPFQVEAGNVDASFEKGVLYISLPRAEADKPRKIEVKAKAA
jgi:HSP20 family protein